MQITLFPFLMLTLALASVAAEATLLRGGSIASETDTSSTQRSRSVFAQEEEEGDDSSLMKNYNALSEERQGFYLAETTVLHDTPGSARIPFVGLYWWCDLEFLSDDATNNYGYVGRGVGYKFGTTTLEDVLAKGGSVPSSKKQALSVSAVMVPSLGIFEGQFHATFDDLVVQYWDNGSATLPTLGWKDEGDTRPNTDTSAFSGSGTFTKITTEAAAELLGMDITDMTPATCSMEYEAVWNAAYVPDPIANEAVAEPLK